MKIGTITLLFLLGAFVAFQAYPQAVGQPPTLPPRSGVAVGSPRQNTEGERAQSKRASTLPGIETKAADGKTFSSLDRPDPREDRELGAGTITLEETDLVEVLKIYQDLSGRTVVRSTALPMVKISLKNETALSRHEALQALDSVLAQNGITMVYMGTKFVKAVTSSQAMAEAPPIIDLPADQLPESSSYMTYIVELTSANPGEVAPALQPFARMPNSIVAINSSGLLILRDYSSNIRRMLRVLAKIDPPQAPPGNKKQ
jgi:type II secretory pathway component GspD/PulD (secretin)